MNFISHTSQRVLDYIGITSSSSSSLSPVASNDNNNNSNNNNHADIKVVKLSFLEEFYCKVGSIPIGTVTLFHGNVNVACELMFDRFIQTVEANPWLCGDICWQNHRDLTIQFPVSPTQAEIQKLFCR